VSTFNLLKRFVLRKSNLRNFDTLFFQSVVSSQAIQS